MAGWGSAKSHSAVYLCGNFASAYELIICLIAAIACSQWRVLKGCSSISVWLNMF